MLPPDSIEIRRLQVRCHVGVPEEEIAAPQTLYLTLRLTPRRPFRQLEDEISRTIDYAAVAQQAADCAARRPRRLIETLATDLAAELLSLHPLARIAVTVEKHILPLTDFVAVHHEAEAP